MHCRSTLQLHKHQWPLVQMILSPLNELGRGSWLWVQVPMAWKFLMVHLITNHLKSLIKAAILPSNSQSGSLSELWVFLVLKPSMTRLFTSKSMWYISNKNLTKQKKIYGLKCGVWPTKLNILAVTLSFCLARKTLYLLKHSSKIVNNESVHISCKERKNFICYAAI